MARTLTLIFLVVLSHTSPTRADDPARPPATPTPPAPIPSVEKLAERLRPSVVVITVAGRDGKRHGLGTGFVVGDGLIATNLHVIGEARPITVETADGRRHRVTEIHASDRRLDLALLKVKADGLVPLKLGDSAALKQGQPVVALGNPAGLTYSVVSGVVSGTREIEGRPMIQVAVPIEPGNSGGPLVDLDGTVRGIITMKSLVTNNLGFAVPVNTLKPLISKPNPIPMARWLTIGALDPQEWQPLMGGRWRQRRGMVVTDGAGDGFGGRTLCLWQKPVPKLPLELTVLVRLDDERGAAGLVFHADGGDRHYGFYPSGGGLRLTRFDGPDVYAWTILAQESSRHYHPGGWNRLTVKLAAGSIRCYVNDHLVIESTDVGLTEGKVGLAKFRETRPEFKQFEVAAKLGPHEVAAERLSKADAVIDTVPAAGAVKPQVLDRLMPDAPASVAALKNRAAEMEARAARFRDLAADVQLRAVLDRLRALTSRPDAEIDLVAAALEVARLDNDDLDPEPYRREVDRMAREVAAGLKPDVADDDKLAALGKYLFTERGFHGSRGDYYNRSNSYLNEVLDDREGLPITLSVLYMEVARRLGVTVVGVGLPGHFVVGYEPAPDPKSATGGKKKWTPRLIDVYEGGVPLTRQEAAGLVLKFAGREATDDDFQPVSKKAILVRMLQNLLGLARGEDDVRGALRYLDAMLTIRPDLGNEHWVRAVYRYQAGRREAALEDVEWVLEHRPDGVDAERAGELKRLLARPEK